MGKYTQLLTSILSGSSDKNIAFEDLCRLLLRLGFDQRIKGDHFIFSRVGVNVYQFATFGENDKTLSS